MNKLLIVLFACLLLFTAVSCSGQSDVSTDASQPTPAAGTDAEAATAKPVRTDYVLRLPENLRLTYQEDYDPDGTERNVWVESVFKIGDAYMMTDPRGYVYYRRKEGNRFTSYTEEPDNTWKECGDCLLHEFFPFVWAVYEDEFYRYDEVVEICGVPCVLYKDRPVSVMDLSYDPDERVRYAFVNEETGVLFELGYQDSRVPILMITEWDTAPGEFPVGAP